MAITKVSPGLLDLDSGITITVTDNSDNLTLVSTDADASVGPNLNLYRNSGSPADSDVLGVVTFNGRNDNSQDVMYARQLSYITDASDGTEDGTFKLQTMVAGTIRDRLNITPSEINLNEDSQDVDFRVESNGNANMLFVDGGNDVVCIGGTTVESGDHFEVLSSDSSTNVRIRNTNAGASSGSVIFDKASSSPADDDQIGLINFIGNDDTGNATVYAQIFSNSTDVSNGTEDGTLSIGTTTNGVYATRATFTGANLALGHTSANVISSTAPTLSMNHPSSSTLSGGISYSSNGTVKAYHYVENDFLLHQTASGVGQKFYNGSGIGLSLDTDGLKFGSDTAAANALDDYEEGSWDPLIIAGTTNPSGGGNLSRDGHYVKIGRQVWVSFYVGVSWTNSPSGGVFVSNMPFTIANSADNTAHIPVTTYNFAFGTNGVPFIAPQTNQANARLYEMGAGGWGAADFASHVTSPLYITGQFTYYTS